MNLTTLKRVLVIILTGLAIVISGCEKSATPSLYVDDEPADRPNPVVTGVEPADAGLAGIGTVTIHGNNFSTVMDENLVFFGKDRATVVSSSTNQIVVSTPNIIADSLELKVAVVGAFGFSNIMRYSLQNAILPYGIYGPGGEQLFGITIDKNENLYVSITPRRIDRVSVDTTEVSFATSTGVIKADNMRIGPNGNLYFVRKTNRLYRLQSGSN
ncbi:MAG: IPT/TIG domain-containing protein [Calditrichia bacterium]